MPAAEYAVASRVPRHYVEVTAGDKPESALSTGDTYLDLDSVLWRWNGLAWVQLVGGA